MSEQQITLDELDQDDTDTTSPLVARGVSLDPATRMSEQQALANEKRAETT